MATGEIKDGKILVTGFNGSTEKENIYKVQVSGTSISDLTSGITVESNIATVRQEKAAEIKLLGVGSTTYDKLDNSLTATATNVLPGTVFVSQAPDFIEWFALHQDSSTAYTLEYKSYPNYGEEDECGVFSLAGRDEYGNYIYSNDNTVCNKKGAKYGTITLYEPESGDTAATVDYFTESLELEYKFGEGEEDFIDSTSIVVESKEGRISVVSFERNSTGGTLTVKFPRNASRHYEETYEITLGGKNIFGDPIISNTFIITQLPAVKNPQFYVSGDDIECTARTAEFIIEHSDTISADTIGIVSYSETIIQTPEISGNRINAETTENTTNKVRELSVIISAVTSEGNTVYAEGVIHQGAGYYLTIPTGSTDTVGVTAYTGSNVTYYSQMMSFRYLALNINNVWAYGDNVFDGVIFVDSNSKTITLNYGQNTGGSDRTCTITVAGYNPLGEISVATYTFTQEGTGDGDFKLISGSTATSATIPNNTSEIRLNIVYPSGKGYSYLGVSENYSTSDTYKVYSTEISNSGDTGELICRVYPNSGNTPIEYTLQVSGVTSDSNVHYTNEFKVTHNTSEATANIRFTTTAGTANANETTKTGIAYTGRNIQFDSVYVSECRASDGAEVTYTLDKSGKKLNLSFPAYPVERRIITVTLGALDNIGNPVSTTTAYTLTQAKSEEASITVIPGTISMDDSNSGTTPTYKIKCVGVEHVEPIYDSNIFSDVGCNYDGVTNNTAKLLINNDSLEEVEYIITFRGVKVVDGSVISTDLKVKQPGRPAQGSITISSIEDIYDPETGRYKVSPNGGAYNLYIDAIDIDPSTIQVFIDPDTGATASTFNDYIYFEDYGLGTGSTHEVLTGGVISDTEIQIPAGNFSEKYFSKMFNVKMDDPSKLSGDTYVYNFELEPDEEEIIDKVFNVYATGTSWTGNDCQSNPISFWQYGTPQLEP